MLNDNAVMAAAYNNACSTSIESESLNDIFLIVHALPHTKTTAVEEQVA
jgi:hypothetical protein